MSRRHLLGKELWTNNILLGRNYCNRGILLKIVGQKVDSALALRLAVAIPRWQSKENPKFGRRRNALALALLNAGHIEVELGRPGRGEPALREALELVRKLLRDDPRFVEYRATLMQAVGYLGEDLFARGQTASAAALLREAVDVGDKITSGEWPSDEKQGGDGEAVELTDQVLSPLRSRMLLKQYARFIYVRGRLEGESGHLDRGLQYCKQARQKQEQALKDAPGDRSLRSEWLSNREAILKFRFLKKEISLASWIEAQRQLLEERKELAGKKTASPQFQGEVGASAAVLAGLLLEAGRAGEALSVVQEVLPAHERLVQAEWRRSAEKALHPVPSLPEGPVIPRAITNIDKDALLAEPAYYYELRRQWTELLARKAEALARTGQDAAAGEAVGQAIAITEGLLRGDHELRCPPASPLSVWSFLAEELYRQEPCYLYDLACHLALASTLPGKGGGRDSAGRAVQALRAYIASGFDNIHKLRTDARLASLQDREDFRQLIGDLEARLKGTKGAP